MATLAEVAAHQQAIDDLVAIALQDLVRFWESLDGATPEARAAELRAFVPQLLTAYGVASGTLAADFYDDLRAAAVTAGVYAAVPADAPGEVEADRLLGWALEPLFPKLTTKQVALMAPEPEPDLAAALSRVARGSQRLIAGVDRGTIITNTRSDPAAVRYVRHASANACAFCAMLATRQDVYRSEQTGSRVSARRNERLGEKYHTNCHCVAVPVWPGQELEEAPYVSDWREAYYAATKELGANDPKAILAHMREHAGLR